MVRPVDPDGQLTLAFKEPLAILSPDQIYSQEPGGSFFKTLKEDRGIERKPIGIHAEELAKYISMWANTKPDGGVVVVGIQERRGGFARWNERLYGSH